MTRAMTKRINEVLQDLILQVQDKEATLEDSKTKFEGSIASQSMATNLFEKGIDLEDPNEGMG